MFKRFFGVASKSFITSLEFRSEIIIWLFLSIIPTLTLFLVWKSIFSQFGMIEGYSLDSIIEYYVIIVIITGIITSHFEHFEAKKIREGDIDLIFTKPISHFEFLLSKSMGRKTFYLLFSLPFTLLTYILLTKNSPFSFSIQQVGVFIFLLFLGYLTRFFISYITVLFAFWFEDSSGIGHFFSIITILFSGAMIPLALMPTWLRNTSEALPLKHLFATPVAVLQENYQITPNDMKELLGFIIFLSVVTWIMWKRGVQSYTSAGG